METRAEYKVPPLSFADDTALGLGTTLEIEPALRAIKYWCDATGMRENEKKRKYKEKGLAIHCLLLAARVAHPKI